MEICKYQLEVKNSQTLLIPNKAKVLTIEAVRGRPWLFVLVNPIADNINRVIRTYEEGDLIKGGTYIGTYKDKDDTFIYHMFDDGEE